MDSHQNSRSLNKTQIALIQDTLDLVQNELTQYSSKPMQTILQDALKSLRDQGRDIDPQSEELLRQVVKFQELEGKFKTLQQVRQDFINLSPWIRKWALLGPSKALRALLEYLKMSEALTLLDQTNQDFQKLMDTSLGKILEFLYFLSIAITYMYIEIQIYFYNIFLFDNIFSK